MKKITAQSWGWLKMVLLILRDAFWAFVEDGCPSMAGALAYYTMISLPGLVVIMLSIAGFVFGEEAVRGHLDDQLRMLIGAAGAEEAQELVAGASRRETGQGLAKALGIAALLFGATGAFAQLQFAMNKVWRVEPDPEQGGVRNFIEKRVLSFGMVLGVAFLLLVSLVISALLGAFGDLISSWLPRIDSELVLRWTNALLSYITITVLFAAVFKVMPDARIWWRDVWIGAAFTSVLFALAKYLIGLYLGNSPIGSAYGAAGSLAIVLIWTYFAAMIVLFGAECTQQWARRLGRRILPAPGAVHVFEKKERVDGSQQRKEK